MQRCKRLGRVVQRGGGRAGKRAKKYFTDAWADGRDAASITAIEVGGKRPKARHSHAAAIVEGLSSTHMFVFGGRDVEAHAFNDLVYLDVGMFLLE